MKTWIEKSNGDWLPVVGDFTVGRFSGNNLVLSEDKRVSRYHALIRIRGTCAWLVDLNSRNGLVRNGRPVSSPVRLREGDMLQVGSTPFIFRTGDLPSDIRHPAEQAPANESELEETKEQHWIILARIEDFAEHWHQLAPGVLEDLMQECAAACARIAKANGGFSDGLSVDRMMLYWPFREHSAASLLNIVAELNDLRRERYLQFHLAVHLAEIAIGPQLIWQRGTMAWMAMEPVLRAVQMAEGMGEDCLFTEGAATALDEAAQLVVAGNIAGTGPINDQSLYRLDECGAAGNPPNGRPVRRAVQPNLARVTKQV